MAILLQFYDSQFLLPVRLYSPWCVVACSTVSFQLDLSMAILLQFYDS
jgi:hypothetical protein